MEKNESAEEREKETVETIEPNTEIISLEIETDNKEEEDEENGKVEKIPEQGNENTRRRVQFKLPMKTAGTGMTLRPKFKKVAETQVRVMLNVCITRYTHFYMVIVLERNLFILFFRYIIIIILSGC